MAESRCGSMCIRSTCGSNCNHGGRESSNHENHSNGTGNSYGGNGGHGQPRPIDAVIDRAKNPPSIPQTNTEPVQSAADELIKKAGETGSTDTVKTTLHAFQNALLIALGIALLPEEIVLAASATLPALTIGPMSEA